MQQEINKITSSIIPEFSSGSSTHAVAHETTKRQALKTLKPISNETPYKDITGRGPAVKAAVQGLSYRRTSAFTLIELLVVVLIIAVLAAIGVAQYQKAVTKSRAANLQTLLAQVVQASDLYYLHHGVYPKTFNELDIDIGLPTVEGKKTCASWAPTSTKEGDDFEISIFDGNDIRAISAHFTKSKYKCRGFIHYYTNSGNRSLEGKSWCGEYNYNLACGTACEGGIFCKDIMRKRPKTYTYQVSTFQ